MFAVACGGGGGGGPGDSSGTPDPGKGRSGTGVLEGFVIDGPVSGAKVVIEDDEGTAVAEAVSDDHGRFTASIPETARYPLSIVSSGGVNLTTGDDPGFTLKGLVAASDQSEVVLSALSTLALHRAECTAADAGGTAAQALAEDDESGLAFLAAHGFGIGAEQRQGLLRAVPRSAEEAATLLLASEALAEALRRATTQLAENGAAVDKDALLATFAHSLADCGVQAQSGGDSTVHLAAFHAAATAVLVEASFGELWVDGRATNAVPKLEEAVGATFGFTDAAHFSTLPINPEFRQQLLNYVHATLAAAPSPALFDYYAEILALENGTPRAELAQQLKEQTNSPELFDKLLSDTVTESELASLIVKMTAQEDEALPPPDLDISAEHKTLASRGTETRLSYSATHASACHRIENTIDGWSGVTGPESSVVVGPIEKTVSFGLICAGPGGMIEQFVDVSPPPASGIQFSDEQGTAQDVFDLGDSVRIDYASAGGSEQNCKMTRSDTGAELSSGSTVTASPDLSLTLTCDGADGVVMSTFDVPVRAAHLQWQAPTESEDGALLTDLAGYRIYHAADSGEYGSTYIAINDPNQVSHVEALSAGTHYFVVTAVTDQGVESRFSNEVVREVP